VGRTYAGILGPLAVTAIAVRTIRHGGEIDAALQLATLCLLGFALLGYVLGQIATMVVEDSVRARVADELAAQQEAAANKTVATGGNR